jgi:peptidyl-tRNA hydrolase
VGKPPTAEQGPNHVLSGFNPDDKAKIEKTIQRAKDGVETFLIKGPEAAMRELNGDLVNEE